MAFNGHAFFYTLEKRDKICGRELDKASYCWSATSWRKHTHKLNLCLHILNILAAMSFCGVVPKFVFVKMCFPASVFLFVLRLVSLGKLL